MIYKAVAGPKQIVSVENEGAQPSVAEFETIINKYAAEGWIYHSMELISAKHTERKKLVPVGSVENHYMLLFYKQN